MTTAYTSLLGLALPVTGELSGTWGQTVNDSITSLLDTSVAGTTNVSTDTDVTLTTTTGAANTARQAILLFSGARTALRTVTAPAQSKVYTVINATTGGFSVKLVGAGPTTGLTIPNGASAVVAWNGSDFVEIGAGSIGNLIVNGTLTVTGATTLQSTLAVTGNITNTAGTANGVTYLNGSKVLTSGSALVFDGTNLGVGTSNPAAFGLFALNGASASANINASTGSAALKFYEGSGTGRGSITSLNGSDGLAFLQGTTEAMRLTSTGLGIGTTGPITKLQVNSGSSYVGGFKSTVANGFVAFQDSGTSGALTDGNVALGAISNDLAFRSGGATRMRLDSAGNLGLGQTPPGNTVYPGLFLQYQTNLIPIGGVGGLYYNIYGVGTQLKWQTSSLGGSAFTFGAGVFEWRGNSTGGTADTNATLSTLMSLDSSGNLTTTGQVNSTRFRAASSTGIDTASTFGYNGTQGTYIFSNVGSARTFSLYNGVGGEQYVIGTDYSHIWYANTAERMRLTAAGLVGVGTSSPATIIDARGVVSAMSTGVDGTFQPAFNATYSGNTLFYGTIAHSMSSVAESSGFRFLGGGLSNLTGTAGQQKLLDITRGQTIFYTGDTERARITSGGQLLVGTTTTSGGEVARFQSATTAYVGIVAATNGGSYLNFGDTSDSNVGFIGYDHTSNYMNFRSNSSEAMRIDSSQNLLVGLTSNPNLSRLIVRGRSGNGYGGGFTQTNSTVQIIGDEMSVNQWYPTFNITTVRQSLTTGNGGFGGIGFSTIDDSNDRGMDDAGRIAIVNETPSAVASPTAMAFYTQVGSATRTNPANERMRIDSSGNLLVGTTAANVNSGGHLFIVGADSNYYIGHSGSPSGAIFHAYQYNGSTIGSITQNGTSQVLYNISSDQRLKENIQDADSASSLIDALQVRQFNWKADGSHQRYGFVAQELATVAPEAVHQPADPEEMMAVDYSKLVPMLVKEIQSLRKRLADAGI